MAQTDVLAASDPVISQQDGQKKAEVQMEVIKEEQGEDCIQDSPEGKLDIRDECSRDDDDGGHRGNSNQKKRNRRKAKGGRHHRKPWKPYAKLTWDEKKKRDDKETVRANKKRDDAFANGLPMAPYNTTQFLMEDQDRPSPVSAMHPLADPSEERHHRDDVSGSFDSSDAEYYNSSNDEETFQEKEFSEAYDTFHAERLQLLTKDELVKEYIELETKNERLEKEVKQMHNDSRSSSDREQPSVTSRLSSEESVDSGGSKVELELKKLREDNARLSRENEFLKAAAGNVTHPPIGGDSVSD